MINIFNFFKSKNKTFEDGDKIIYSGRGGISYIDSNENMYNFGWLWDENVNLYKEKNIDLFFPKNGINKKILERLFDYCNTHNISYDFEE